MSPRQQMNPDEFLKNIEKLIGRIEKSIDDKFKSVRVKLEDLKSEQAPRAKVIVLEKWIAGILLVLGFAIAVNVFNLNPFRERDFPQIQISLENNQHKAQKPKLASNEPAIPGADISDVDYYPGAQQPMLLITIADDVDTVRIADVVRSEVKPSINLATPHEAAPSDNPGCFDLTIGTETESGQGYVSGKDLNPNSFQVNDHDPKHQTTEPFFTIFANKLTVPRSGFTHTVICTIKTKPSLETDTERVILFRNFGQKSFRSNLTDEHAVNIRIIGDGVTSVSSSAAFVPFRRNDTYAWTDENAASWHENGIFVLGIILGLVPTLLLDILTFEMEAAAKRKTADIQTE